MSTPTPIQYGQKETDSPSRITYPFSLAGGHTGGYTANTPCQNYCMDMLGRPRQGLPGGWEYWYSYVWFWNGAPIDNFNRCVTNCMAAEWRRQQGIGAM